MDITAQNKPTSNGAGDIGARCRTGFRCASQAIARAMGSPWSFLVALLLIVGWAVSGRLFGFSDTWQLVINTSTTIITFLMVFIIQSTQNRDTRAIQLKLDELLRGVTGARTGLVNLEGLTDEQLDDLQKEFEKLQSRGGERKQTKATGNGRRKASES